MLKIVVMPRSKSRKACSPPRSDRQRAGAGRRTQRQYGHRAHRREAVGAGRPGRIRGLGIGVRRSGQGALRHRRDPQAAERDQDPVGLRTLAIGDDEGAAGVRERRDGRTSRLSPERDEDRVRSSDSVFGTSRLRRGSGLDRTAITWSGQVMCQSLFTTAPALLAGLRASRGGAPERIGATILSVGSVLTPCHGIEPGGSYGSVETGVFIVDVATLIAFLILALRARRFWPLWMTALQLIGTPGHLVKLADPEMIPQGLCLRCWSSGAIRCCSCWPSAP